LIFNFIKKQERKKRFIVGQNSRVSGPGLPDGKKHFSFICSPPGVGKGVLSGWVGIVAGAKRKEFNKKSPHDNIIHDNQPSNLSHSQLQRKK
jgi:hypothetical protein